MKLGMRALVLIIYPPAPQVKQMKLVAIVLAKCNYLRTFVQNSKQTQIFPTPSLVFDLSFDKDPRGIMLAELSFCLYRSAKHQHL